MQVISSSRPLLDDRDSPPGLSWSSSSVQALLIVLFFFIFCTAQDSRKIMWSSTKRYRCLCHAKIWPQCCLADFISNVCLHLHYNIIPASWSRQNILDTCMLTPGPLVVAGNVGNPIPALSRWDRIVLYWIDGCSSHGIPGEVLHKVTQSNLVLKLMWNDCGHMWRQL